MADEGKPGAPNVDIIVNGKEIPDGDIKSWVVDRKMGYADTASITVTNQSDVHADSLKPGQSLEIKIGKDKKTVFMGTVRQGMPTSGNGGGSSAAIRGVGKLDSLRTLGAKSLTFQDKNDKQIIEEILSKAGLTLEFKGPQIVHKHVYQHNLNALDFITQRASRIGCHIWGWDKKVFVKEPDFSKTASTKLSVDKAGILRSFKPYRFDGAGLKKVTVKSWDPEKKELIVHTETASGSKLGSKHASAAADDGGTPELFVVDEPVASKEEAKALAKARLLERNLNFITGQAKCAGSADFELADVVEIEQNAMGKDPFNGKYYVMGIKHEHVLSKSANEGFVTVLSLARDAEDG